MQSKLRIWNLYNQAKQFGQTPSAILGIRKRWLAYQVDEVVYLVGRDIEGKDGQYKRKSDGTLEKVHDLRKLLGLEPILPPKLDTKALRNSPWAGVKVVRVPSSHKQTEPSP